jgi:hypothetical protein
MCRGYQRRSRNVPHQTVNVLECLAPDESPGAPGASVASQPSCAEQHPSVCGPTGRNGRSSSFFAFELFFEFFLGASVVNADAG